MTNVLLYDPIIAIYLLILMVSIAWTLMGFGKISDCSGEENLKTFANLALGLGLLFFCTACCVFSCQMCTQSIEDGWLTEACCPCCVGLGRCCCGDALCPRHVGEFSFKLDPLILIS